MGEARIGFIRRPRQRGEHQLGGLELARNGPRRLWTKKDNGSILPDRSRRRQDGPGSHEKTRIKMREGEDGWKIGIGIGMTKTPAGGCPVRAGAGQARPTESGSLTFCLPLVGDSGLGRDRHSQSGLVLISVSAGVLAGGGEERDSVPHYHWLFHHAQHHPAPPTLQSSQALDALDALDTLPQKPSQPMPSSDRASWTAIWGVIVGQETHTANPRRPFQRFWCDGDNGRPQHQPSPVVQSTRSTRRCSSLCPL